MKRIICIAFSLIVTLVCLTATASPIAVEGLDREELYKLNAQVQSQIMLNQFQGAEQYSSSFNYDDIERNPGKHTGEKIRFEGKIIQVVEGSGTTTYRISSDTDDSNIFLVTYSRPEDSDRFLEDDQVCVYAEFVDLNTYQSTTKLSVTVPYCRADLIIRPITDSNVASATNEELEATQKAIREKTTEKMTKEKGYTKLTNINYSEFARQENLHKNELITVSGKVLQVVEGSSAISIRLAVNFENDMVIFLTMDSELSDIRILEDDSITVKGQYTGLYTYSSVRGGEITVPSATVESVSVKGYETPKSIPKDKDGKYKLTAKLFEDYARRPKAHMNETITFSAKVLQVIEGSNTSEYRMAIDSDNDRVIYVTIASGDRTTRILEDDKVNVVATFTGLLTYESTMGVSITVPQCVASSIDVPGKKTTTAKKGAGGNYKVTKKNYEAFARDEQTYKGSPISFKAKVVQVVDGDNETIYRLAVDKSYDAMFLGSISKDKLSIRILEDDIVTIEGTSTGLYSYSSTRGGKITIPSCEITKYKVEGYKQQKLGKPDKEGYLKITKKNYDELARNPDPYKGENITFKGKVLQVVERGGGSNIYRVAVDSKSSKVFYVEYDLPAGASRILEKDVVTLKGEYYGIYTYETTMGSSVSVPALIATEIKK